jgi:hypothetical protein
MSIKPVETAFGRSIGLGWAGDMVILGRSASLLLLGSPEDVFPVIIGDTLIIAFLYQAELSARCWFRKALTVKYRDR